MAGSFRANCYRGGLSSLAIQPTASVFKGSTGKEIFWIQWQVLHSKVRSSRPRLPGDIRVNPILCLQVGHDGRSAMELLITSRHSEANDRYDQNFGPYACAFCPTKFWHNY
jgi:hypothetical protein